MRRVPGIDVNIILHFLTNDGICREDLLFGPPGVPPVPIGIHDNAIHWSKSSKRL
ncbi:MAG: hypothetical protein HPY52_12510 [Firmicutes bacterium]|nr:hypothetical protein [Bacillota bacterium]